MKTSTFSTAGAARFAWPVMLLSLASAAMAGGDPECPNRPLSIEPFEVTTNADGAKGLCAADLDGDLDLDVISASSFDDTLAWYENDGADPPGFTEHIVTTSFDGAQSATCADIDGDGDLDFAATANFGDMVSWFENDGGDPPAFIGHVVDGAADGAVSANAVDLDGDGDMDILAGATNGDTVSWYESDGAPMPGFTGHLIAVADGVTSVFPFDIDNDGDLDVVAGFGSNVSWYESDGADPPAFTPHPVVDTLVLVQSVKAADLDNDGDGDVLSASLIDGIVAWYENDGGDPPAFTQRLITGSGNRPSSVFASDVDLDGNVDVLWTSSNGDTVTWSQNDGGSPPSFQNFTISNDVDSAQNVVTADLNDDGQPDALTASFNDDKIAFFRLTEPELGTCCLSDSTCQETTCLADCAAIFGWQWDPGLTCADVTCPGKEAPSLFMVEKIDADIFKQRIVDLAAFETRFWNRPQNHEAVLLIKSWLESFGYNNVTLDPYMFQGVQKFNIYATKMGTTRPTEMYILGAHMDSFNVNGDFDHAPGADDDGSGSASVLEMARVFANVETDVSVRFCLWNNEETGLNGSAAYVANHRDLQGTMEEPTWLGMIQEDMILFDRFAQRDVDVEFQASAQNDGRAVILGAFVTGAMGRYGTGEFPAQETGNMRNTDSVSFMNDITAISVRENTRDEIGNGSNPHWHQTTDRPETYTDEDYRQGFNTIRMIAGAVGELVGARPSPCPADLDGDGMVGFSDLLDILAAWGPCQGCPQDLDGDDMVGFSDLLIVLGSWGPCP